MTQHSAHDLCLSFLSQRKCGDEKKLIPFSCREGVERNRNLLCFLQATPANLSSLWVWPVASLTAFSLLLPSSSKWECPVATWKENWSLCQNCHVRVSNIFGQYDHRLPTQSKGRCRPSLKGKPKSCANMLCCVVLWYQLCQSVQSSTASTNVCLHKAETEAAKAELLFLMREESKETHTLTGFSLFAQKCYLYLALWLNHAGDGVVFIGKGPAINCIWQVIKLILSVQVSAFAHIVDRKEVAVNLSLQSLTQTATLVCYFSVKWEFHFSSVHEKLLLWETNGQL